MNDKSKMMESMENLIPYISMNKSQQQQIYSTFAKLDLLKIISNLSDSNQNIRKTTLIMLASLLHNNIKLQNEFCDIMNIPYLPGKLILSSRLQHLQLKPHTLREAYRIIKEQTAESDAYCLYWYIDTNNEKPNLIYVTNCETKVDPMYTIAGIMINKKQREEKKTKIVEFNPLKFKPSSDQQYQKCRLDQGGRVSQNKYLLHEKLNKTMKIDGKIPIAYHRQKERKHSGSYRAVSKQSLNRGLTDSFKSSNPQLQTLGIQYIPRKSIKQPAQIIQDSHRFYENHKQMIDKQVKYIKPEHMSMPNTSRQSYPVALSNKNYGNQFHGYQKGMVRFQPK